MQLKFKLTDTATGADTKHCPSRFAFELNESGDLCVRDNLKLTPRLFTGLRDSAGNEIYDGDVLAIPAHKNESAYVVRFINGQFFAYCKTSGVGVYPEGFKTLGIIGNRWQPEFREVFGND